MGEDGGLTYGPRGVTAPQAPVRPASPPGFRRFEATVTIGRGEDVRNAAGQAVLRWEVKRRSGFAVAPADGGGVGARERGRYTVTAGLGRCVVREPVEVVAVVETGDRCGFAYGTREGHPVSGEEAFVVHRDDDGRVLPTLRSLTRAAPRGSWRPLFPVLPPARLHVRGRCLRALRDAGVRSTGPRSRPRRRPAPPAA
ncbi:DUF1990 family protein [Streptomyces sp. XY152]|uniref:DUF1990 family protein n=1 Tax=Streptomyces sp. XY152 TaxID=1415560 RepID=UPI0007C6A7DA|nr:DUF1990 family protein [Streptomyces sp. XY152]